MTRTLYTPADDHIIAASYEYALTDVADERKAQEAAVDPEKERRRIERLTQEEQEIRALLGTLRFPRSQE